MRAEDRDSEAAGGPGSGETVPGEMGRLENDLMEREGEQRRGEAERRSDQGKIAGRERNGSRARGLLEVEPPLARARVEKGRGSTSAQADRRELDRVLAHDRADHLQRSRDLLADVTAVRDGVGSGAASGRNGSRARDLRAEDAMAVPSAEENGRGSTSGLADRRELDRDLERDRADRLQRSRGLAADARVVRQAAVNGRDSISGQVGHRELDQVLARERADRLRRSRGLAAGEIRVRARALEEVRKKSRAGFRGLVARGMTKLVGRRRVGIGQQRRLERDLMAARGRAATQGRVVSKGRTSREVLRGRVDFRNREGRAGGVEGALAQVADLMEARKRAKG
jgi:hypothetical protein